MIKGVNRQVVEVNETQCEYFEKVLFFVKPEFAAVSEGKLRERANLIAHGAGAPPPTRIRKKRFALALMLAAAACAGAVVCGFLLTAL